MLLIAKHESAMEYKFKNKRTIKEKINEISNDENWKILVSKDMLIQHDVLLAAGNLQVVHSRHAARC
jgi:hypothetical protein